MWNHRMDRRMTRDEWRVPLCVVVTVQPVCLVHAFCTGSTDTTKVHSRSQLCTDIVWVPVQFLSIATKFTRVYVLCVFIPIFI
jgi:hypothetical protein